MSPPPEISVALSLDPNSYSYSSSNPPTLSVTITSHADKPLTVFAWSNIFRPSLALLQKGFSIENLTTQTEVHPQHSVYINRTPFKRVKGHSDEQYFLTLSPGEPLNVTALFGYRAGGYGAPRPAGHPDRIKVGPRSNEYERTVCGVDGLVPGDEYELRAVGKLAIGWWRWGTKDEVLEPVGSTNWQMGESEGPLKLLPEEIEPVRFTVEL